MLSFEFPIIELVDRYTIAMVKFEKTNGANIEELNFYENQISRLDKSLIFEELESLINLHKKIWSLEDDFKKCRIDGVDLSIIGQRALEIRDYNNQRVMYKNLIAEKLGSPVKEIKNHLQL